MEKIDLYLLKDIKGTNCDPNVSSCSADEEDLYPTLNIAVTYEEGPVFGPEVPAGFYPQPPPNYKEESIDKSQSVTASDETSVLVADFAWEGSIYDVLPPLDDAQDPTSKDVSYLMVNDYDPDHNVLHGGFVYFDTPSASHKFLSYDFAIGEFHTQDSNGEYSDTRWGIQGELNALSFRLGSTWDESVTWGGPKAGLDISAGTDGLSVGGGLSVVSIDGTVGDLDPNSDKGGKMHFGLSAGPSIGGRLHWGDKDNDGSREYGFGFDYGPVSFDIMSEGMSHAAHPTLPSNIENWPSSLQDTHLPDHYIIPANIGAHAGGTFYRGVTVHYN